jgi:glutaredoxin 3
MGTTISNPATSSPSLSVQSNATDTLTYFNEFISKEIHSNDIVIFSQTNCSYCKRAKTALANMNQAYHAIELDINSQCSPREDCKSLTRTLILLTHMKTVPQIFIKGKLIGGFTELDNLIKTNQFEDILKK